MLLFLYIVIYFNIVHTQNIIYAFSIYYKIRQKNYNSKLKIYLLSNLKITIYTYTHLSCRLIQKIAFTILQITTFFTSHFTSKFAIKVFSCVLFLSILTIYYTSFRFNIKTVKDLMEQLHCACTKLRDKNEIAIIQEYGRTANRVTAACVVLFGIIKPAFWAIQIAIPYLDNVTPINGCRPHRLYIAVEYFIDQEKYYYVILIHMNAALFIGILSLMASATLMLMFFQHACGMFKIACYRIENAIEINALKNISFNSELSISKKIVYAVDIHREAMQITDHLMNRFDTMYFCLVVLSVITLSLNLFQISQSVIFEDNIKEAIIPTVSVLVISIYVFLANVFGQHITDHNNEIYAAAYNIRWYLCPHHVQRLIVLLLQRKAKQFHITCGGMFIASYECFATVNGSKSNDVLLYSHAFHTKIRKKHITKNKNSERMEDHFSSLIHLCSNRCTDMICLEAQYFNLNRILLQGTAQWPFEQSKLVRLQFIINWTILVSAIICQLKDLMRQLHCACTKLRDKNEIAIIQEYGRTAKRLTAACVVFVGITKLAFWAVQIVIPYLDNVAPINGCRPRRLYIDVEYFIDQEKYYYVILIHMNAALFIGILTVIATGTLMIMFFQHACGMFKIACYRIEHAIEINTLKHISFNSEPSISKKIVYAVNIHREAMQITDHLMNRFDTTYFCLTVLSVITLSLNLFQISQSVIFEHNIKEAIIPTVSVLVISIYVFLANVFGQHITDHNNEIYAAAYNIRWYLCPHHVQRLIVLLLQRKAKQFHITCGGMFIASYECFATVNGSKSNDVLLYSHAFHTKMRKKHITKNKNSISEAIILEGNIGEAIMPTISVVGLFIYTFLGCAFGQHITDYNNEVYAAAYNIRWYLCPQHVQRLIVLMLQRKAKQFHLTCGGLFIASYECFAMVAKATMSYFTLMHSTRS
ncbi:uncharacterized protein LOC105276768 isoform X6 [Ooceraea biroi]|uniref:uncharacterized protein LOC105276768 isoform X6 n=1 Tax=Ooceraea biroi TaxID=2015173 RepID=UPI000F074F8B|nr:uncharacterized protein LOC105276768 isoform X6 [Ooceraea biroi]